MKHWIVKKDKVKFTLCVGDCCIDIIIRENKNYVHYEDVPTDCRKDYVKALTTFLTMASICMTIITAIMLILVATM